MTDEEKKAIERIEMLVEYLKKWNKNFTVVPEDAKYFEKILDMTKTHIRMIDENIEEILQQSKEIEELSDKLTEKICKGVEEEILEEYRQTIISKDKEIEELKEKNKTLKNLQNDTNRLYIGMIERKNYFERELQKLEDKIKAKIEVMNTNTVNAEKFDCDYIGQCRFAKYVLQSLLEKE